MAAINDGKIYKRDFSLCDSNKNSSNKSNKKEKEVIDIFVAKSKTEDLYWNNKNVTAHSWLQSWVRWHNINYSTNSIISSILQKKCEKPTPLGVGWIAQY